MPLNLTRIKYEQLNARQRENYNYQNLSAVLADYGFVTMRLSDDWEGADLIAQHINGDTFLKIQLKGDSYSVRSTLESPFISPSPTETSGIFIRTMSC
jgi:hypothetical protein